MPVKTGRSDEGWTAVSLMIVLLARTAASSRVEHPHDRLGDADRLVLAGALEAHQECDVSAAGPGLDALQGQAQPDPIPDRERSGEADPVEPVIDHHGE